VGIIIISEICKMRFLLHFLVVSKLRDGNDGCSGIEKIPRVMLCCTSHCEKHRQILPGENGSTYRQRQLGRRGVREGVEHPSRMTIMNLANIMLVI